MDDVVERALMVAAMADGLVAYHGNQAIVIAKDQAKAATGESAFVWAAIVEALSE